MSIKVTIKSAGKKVSSKEAIFRKVLQKIDEKSSNI